LESFGFEFFCGLRHIVKIGAGLGLFGTLHLAMTFNRTRELCASLKKKLGENPHL